MVRQRVHAVALGYEDLNDHDALRDDPVVQTACERDESLASSSTLCRFEQRAERQWVIAIQRQLVEQFIGSFEHRPEELVLDFDATDDPVHGHQPGRFFHGYYDGYCFLPLYVFCASSCWSRTFGPRTSMRRSMPGRYCRCCSNGCARRGPVFVSCFGATRGSADTGCSIGAIATTFITSWGWPEMRFSNARFRWRARSPGTGSRRPERRIGYSTSSSTRRGAGGAPGGSSPASSTVPRDETRASS